MALTINFSKVSDTFEPMLAGEYEVKLIDFKPGKTSPTAPKAPNADKVDLQLQVVEEPVEGQPNYKNRRLFVQCILTEESLWRFKRVMNAFEADVDWNEDVDVIEVIRDVIRSQNTAMAKVSIREFTKTGETEPTRRNNVDDVVRLRGTSGSASSGWGVMAEDATGAAEVIEAAPKGRK